MYFLAFSHIFCFLHFYIKYLPVFFSIFALCSNPNCFMTEKVSEYNNFAFYIIYMYVPKYLYFFQNILECCEKKMFYYL